MSLSSNRINQSYVDGETLTDRSLQSETGSLRNHNNRCRPKHGVRVIGSVLEELEFECVDAHRQAEVGYIQMPRNLM